MESINRPTYSKGAFYDVSQTLSASQNASYRLHNETSHASPFGEPSGEGTCRNGNEISNHSYHISDAASSVLGELVPSCDLEVAAFPSIDLEHRLFSTKAALLYFDKEDHSLTSRSSLCSSCSAVIGDRLLQRDSVTSPRKAKDWVVVAPSRGYWNPTPR